MTILTINKTDINTAGYWTVEIDQAFFIDISSDDWKIKCIPNIKKIKNVYRYVIAYKYDTPIQRNVEFIPILKFSDCPNTLIVARKIFNNMKKILESNKEGKLVISVSEDVAHLTFSSLTKKFSVSPNKVHL